MSLSTKSLSLSSESTFSTSPLLVKIDVSNISLDSVSLFKLNAIESSETLLVLISEKLSSLVSELEASSKLLSIDKLLLNISEKEVPFTSVLSSLVSELANKSEKVFSLSPI